MSTACEAEYTSSPSAWRTPTIKTLACWWRVIQATWCGLNLILPRLVKIFNSKNEKFPRSSHAKISGTPGVAQDSIRVSWICLGVVPSARRKEFQRLASVRFVRFRGGRGDVDNVSSKTVSNSREFKLHLGLS